MDQEKIKLLAQIREGIIERYKKTNVPMIFKTMDCSEDVWYGKNLNSGKVSKLKFIPSDMGTEVVTLSTEYVFGDSKE